MAQRVQVSVVDDLDGSVASESVRFGLDGQQYEIDLSVENAARLRASLALYLSAARHAAQQGHRLDPLDSGHSARVARNRAETTELRALAARTRNEPIAASANPSTSPIVEPPTPIDARPAASAPGKRGPIVTDPFQIPPAVH